MERLLFHTIKFITYIYFKLNNEMSIVKFKNLPKYSLGEFHLTHKNNKFD